MHHGNNPSESMNFHFMITWRFVQPITPPQKAQSIHVSFHTTNSVKYAFHVGCNSNFLFPKPEQNANGELFSCAPCKSSLLSDVPPQTAAASHTTLALDLFGFTAPWGGRYQVWSEVEAASFSDNLTADSFSM